MLRPILEQMAAFSLSYCSESIENKERQLVSSCKAIQNLDRPFTWY